MIRTIDEKRAVLQTLNREQFEVVNEAIMECCVGNQYDAPMAWGPGGKLVFQWPKRIQQALDTLEAWRTELGLESPTVLDVGCWHGKITAELLQRGFQVYSTDLAENMGQYVANLVGQLPEDCQKRWGGFYGGWFHEMNFMDCDFVLCLDTLEHIPDWAFEDTVRALGRATKYRVYVNMPPADDWMLHLRSGESNNLYRLMTEGKEVYGKT